MSKIRFYMDEHISRAIIRGLRQRDIDVLSVPEANMMGVSDSKQLLFAHSEHRVLLTYDDDFLRLAATGLTQSGIIFAARQISIGETIRKLMLIYQVLEAEDMINRIEFL